MKKDWRLAYPRAAESHSSQVRDEWGTRLSQAPNIYAFSKNFSNTGMTSRSTSSKQN